MEALEEKLIDVWIELTAKIKNNRITKSISYNEAVILNLVYNSYLKESGVYIQEILKKTKMLKSLCNRTLNQLLAKDFIYRRNIKNQGIIYFNPVKEQEYLRIHQETLNYIAPIIDILGENDTREFIRIISKLLAKEESV